MIYLNDFEVQFGEGMSLELFMERAFGLNLIDSKDHLTVLNNRLVARSQFSEIILKNGDVLKSKHILGGG